VNPQYVKNRKILFPETGKHIPDFWENITGLGDPELCPLTDKVVLHIYD
jgi:hypothetical protein